jgi:hypothetical protein
MVAFCREERVLLLEVGEVVVNLYELGRKLGEA